VSEKFAKPDGKHMEELDGSVRQEAGKTMQDGMTKCAESRRFLPLTTPNDGRGPLCQRPSHCQAPTGESNELYMEGPRRFPADQSLGTSRSGYYTGKLWRLWLAGNYRDCNKPAEQTSLVACVDWS